MNRIMSIQDKYCIIFMCLAVLQIICAIMARKSDRPIGKYTGRLNLAITVPMVANALIIESRCEHVSYFGYYLSYIGMNAIMIALIHFTNRYCKGVDENKTHRKPYFIYFLALADIVQLILGSVFHHVISLEKTVLDGRVFYRDVPHFGLQLHRIIDYTIFACVLLIYIVSIIKTSKLYREKYSVILTAMILAGVSQFAFISSRIPIDRSIIVHGVFGIVVFYFSIIHRPLRLLDTLLSHVVSNLNDAVFVFDNDNKCVWVNEQGYSLLDIEEGKLNQVKTKLFDRFKNITGKGENWKENRQIGDNYYILEKQSVKTDQKYLDGSFLVIKDDTERHIEIEKELFNSVHDSLTGLYNMQYLYSNIKNLMLSSDQDFYIIFINIKNFKLINENFGKSFGDIVLLRIAKWLNGNIKSGLHGRLVGDTFGICMPREDFSEQLFLDDMTHFDVKFRDREHRINIHIGVYGVKDKNTDVSSMFDRAHLAITDIEENYKTVIRYYNDEIKNTLLEEQRLVADFIDAINTNQIIPYLQPIADRNGKVVGAEALARWIHPELGFLPPVRFVPLFEKNGMITDLDKCIWKKTCEVLSHWKETHPDLFISINISPKDFYFTDVLSDIRQLVEEHEIEPGLLRIEITETAMMTESEERIHILSEFRNAGFVVEMDDFGSGYSSLNLLKDMPVDVLKMDMKFLSDENNDKSNRIIKNIIHLANELDIVPLTEGVETEEQYSLLKDMGCQLFQGYYFAKPMPVREFEKFLVNS